MTNKNQKEPNITLNPLTDKDGPEWVHQMAAQLVAAAATAKARFISSRGTHHHAEAWVYVVTASHIENNVWHVHASWFDEDDANGAAYSATVREVIA